MRRKKATIENKEAESKVRNKVQEIRNPKYLPGPGLCYGGAVFKAERARIICVDQEVEKISLDPLDHFDTGESLEAQVSVSPSKKIKIDMKKRNECDKESEIEEAAVKKNESNVKKDIISKSQVEDLNDKNEDKEKSRPSRSERRRGNGEWTKGQHSWNISITKEARMDPEVVLDSSAECLFRGIFFCP